MRARQHRQSGASSSAAGRSLTFGQLLHPVTTAEFFADYHHRRWLHVRGARERFADVMSWEDLNGILNMDVWTSQTLQLMMDRRRVPPGAYCRAAVDRSRNQVMQPDADRVTGLLRAGASLLLNEIETLHPGVLRLVRTFQEALGAKSSANLYCSWQQRQAFDSHYDRHDVYALHIVGEKRWRIYEGRADNPIEHPAFHNIPQADYDRMKGRVAEEVVMRPGDLLYLPRGQFHDALASSEASIHVTFSCSEPNGLDWLTVLWNRAIGDSLFRTDLPQASDADGDQALLAHLRRLGARLQDMMQEPQTIEQIRAARRDFGLKRPDYRLSGPSSAPPPRGQAKPH